MQNFVWNVTSVNKCIYVTLNARISIINDTADIDNWEGKTIQIYVYELPEQILKTTKRFFFFTELNFSHVILLYLAKYRLILLNLTDGLWGWAPNKVWGSSGGKLLIKFGESQGAQDVKTATSYWQNNICFASNWQNLWILKLKQVPLLGNSVARFSNFSGIWNRWLPNKHEGADKICLQLEKIHGKVIILY